MKRLSVGVLSLLAGLLLVTSPALAGGKKHTTSCKQIRAALASGKSTDEVANEFKVSTERVNHCAKEKSAKKKSATSHSAAKQE